MVSTADAKKKRPHSLHRSRDAIEFEASFEAETGRGIKGVVRELCREGEPCGVVLGGSLPLGLATPVSDVDLLVLLDDPGSEVLAKASAGSGVLFSGRFAGHGAGIARAEIVAFFSGIEVNCQILSAAAIEDAGRRIARAQVSLTPYEIGLLSRLKTGWTLERNATFDNCCAALLQEEALEIHSTVWYLVGSAQDLEDALAAMADSPMLAMHLGRASAERAVLAYFAAHGFAFVGAKWMRAFEPANGEGPLGRIASELPGGRAALGVLFPALDHDGGAKAYLAEVQGFIKRVREKIERQQAYKIAIALCPQLRAAA